MKTVRIRQGCVLVLLSLSAAPATQAASRLNAGTVQWAAAAREGRADMLFLGDSIVSYGKGGWSAGVAQRAKETVGLAGSGLLAAPHDVPFVWSTYTGARIMYNGQLDSTVTGAPSLTPSGRYFQADSNFGFVATGTDPVTLDVTRPIDWHVFATGASSDARIQATQTRRTNSPWSATVVQTTPIQPVVNSTTSLQDYVFSFDGQTDPGDWTTYAFTPESRDAYLHYNKLIYRDGKGITVSGWSYSGGMTETFRDQYYNHSRFTEAGRDAYYHALVEGNSGKLNVAITFGVNDARAKTPAAYGESIRGLVADVRRDWQDAGLDLSDLSFSLFSAYQVDNTAYPSDAYLVLQQYRGVLDAIAAGDAQISFIDIWEAGPTSQEARANGYLDDPVHPSEAGTAIYAKVALSQLMPTPGDADIDGRVDFDDLLTLAQHYGDPAATTWRAGDFDGVGGVTFDDLLALAQHYGEGTGLSAGSFEADWQLARSIVPEPSTLSALLIVAARRRRA